MAISSVTFRVDGRQCYADIVQTAAARRTVIIGQYSKIITEQAQTINLTPYLREMFKYSAPTEEGDLLRDNRAVLPVVTIDGFDYYADRVYNGSSNMAQVATKLPYRLIAPKQTDVLYIGNIGRDMTAKIYKDGELLNMMAPEGVANRTMVSAKVKGITDSCEVRVVGAYSTDIDFEETVRYVVKPMGLNGKRLAWINELGGIDMWNFDHLREQSFAATSETIYTQSGYAKLNTAAEQHYVVETREITEQTLNILSYIIASPAVWVVTDTGTGNPAYEPVDVVTEECKIYSDADLLALQISYRPKQRVL